MPLELQGRLLRVLQERSLSRLGSTQTIKVDCALICATHRDLKLLSANQGFREDLYYRINGLRVTLPVLRERRDLPELIRHLLQLEAIDHKRVVLSESALQALLAYSWPGNIRQLYQTLRLAAALAEDEGMIGLQHLPDEILDGCVSEVKLPLESGEVRLMARDTLQASEQRIIRAAVDACGGNLSAAARNLGIARATLYRKLKLIEEGAETMASPMPWNGLNITE
ncbi:Acetoin catabolism regulatory protein [compost metagenome]